MSTLSWKQRLKNVIMLIGLKLRPWPTLSFLRSVNYKIQLNSIPYIFVAENVCGFWNFKCVLVSPWLPVKKTHKMTHLLKKSYIDYTLFIFSVLSLWYPHPIQFKICFYYYVHVPRVMPSQPIILHPFLEENCQKSAPLIPLEIWAA